MKSLFIFCLCSVLSLSALADEERKVGNIFTCKSKGLEIEHSDRSAIDVPYVVIGDKKELDMHLIGLTQMLADCQNTKGEPYSLYYEGGGPGLAIQNDYFVVSCPLVSKKRFEDRPLDGNGLPKAAWFGGLKVNATAGAGATVGIFTNHALGVCVMTGVNLGIGAGVSAGRLGIKMGADSFRNDRGTLVLQ